jgi:hypothetical protein
VGPAFSTKSTRSNKAWRRFELLVASIEGQLAPEFAVIKSPDHIRDIDTGKLREVDASIRMSIGSAEILVTIECRRRNTAADITWIEQLATKRVKLGASKTIAVSAQGFSPQAIQSAARYGIETRTLKPLSDGEVHDWFKPDGFLHYYRSVTDFTCDVITESGECLSVGPTEPRFREANVHGLFPASAFLNFIELKAPDTFKSVPLDGTPVSFTFELKGDQPDIIPVPLGESRKNGPLTVDVSGTERCIRNIRLELKITHISKLIQPTDGKHSVYGPPDDAQHVASQYETEMFGLPVSIEHHSRKEAKSAPPTLTFPNGLKLQASTFNPRLYDMDMIDTSVLQMKPVTIKLQDGKVMQGVFIELTRELLADDTDRDRLSNEAFVFVKRSDLEWVRRNVGRKPNARLNRRILRIIPKRAIEYVDISAALGA